MNSTDFIFFAGGAAGGGEMDATATASSVAAWSADPAAGVGSLVAGSGAGVTTDF